MQQYASEGVNQRRPTPNPGHLPRPSRSRQHPPQGHDSVTSVVCMTRASVTSSARPPPRLPLPYALPPRTAGQGSGCNSLPRSNSPEGIWRAPRLFVRRAGDWGPRAPAQAGRGGYEERGG
eukprot:3028697-Pyramimonas_sp.AAC.1